MSTIKQKFMNAPESKACRISSDAFLPLELTTNNHICLWSEDNEYKWTIGYFQEDSEGPWFKFVGDRPINERVNWNDFRKLVELGYAFTQHHFDAKRKNPFD